MPISVKENEIVTCTKGHPLYRITANEVIGSSILPSRLFECINTQHARPPVKYTAVRGTCGCGARWLQNQAMDSVPFAIHFEEGWRIDAN